MKPKAKPEIFNSIIIEVPIPKGDSHIYNSKPLSYYNSLSKDFKSSNKIGKLSNNLKQIGNQLLAIIRNPNYDDF